MSMYNAVFGVNRQAPIILAMLGLTPSDVGRFRDCFVSEGKIHVYLSAEDGPALAAGSPEEEL